jgi:hypothetical protein
LESDESDNGENPKKLGLLVDFADGVGRSRQATSGLEIVVELGRGRNDTEEKEVSTGVEVKKRRKRAHLVLPKADCFVSSRMSPKVLQGRWREEEKGERSGRAHVVMQAMKL